MWKLTQLNCWKILTFTWSLNNTPSALAFTLLCATLLLANLLCVSLMFLFTSSKWRMATTEPQASVNGYMYKFIDNLPDDMICLICQFPACNPHQRDCCGKIFCKACLDEHEKHSNQCPNCRQNGKNFYDKRSERQIKSLKMSCENEEKGCKWQGELFNLESHTKDCQYAVISCSNQCPEQIMRKDLELHLLNNCQLREHRCPTCNQSGPYQTMTTTHLDQCPETIVPEWVWSTWHGTEGPHQALCTMSCWRDPMWIPWMWHPTSQGGTKEARRTVPVGASPTLKDCVSSHFAKPEGTLGFDSAVLHFTIGTIAMHGIVHLLPHIVFHLWSVAR